ncbi:Ig-like domain-containing protein [Desulfobacterales bacterium HSG2]|nr:Ig-like domain-containing protein [Desulfobacterales bacterium HSG2]
MMKSKMTVFFTGVVFLILTAFRMASGAVSLEPNDYTISADSYFGCSVSVSGDYAIIGASGDNHSTGAAYIFQRTGTDSWTQQQKLTAEDGASSDRFGASVAISSDYAIIGVPHSDGEKGSNAGSAYIFKREGATWLQEAKITADDAAPNDLFGGSVSIYGDYAIIGSAYNDINGSESGAAYVFRREGSDWLQHAKLLPEDGAGYDYFGVSVSISAGLDPISLKSEWYAIVGAHTHNDPVTNTSFGAAYIFGPDASGTWVQQEKFMPDDSAAGDQFGISVSISGIGSGWYAIVGAEGDDDSGLGAGSAYIFTLSESTWIQQTKLTPPASSAGDHFGRSVSISDDYAIVGASGDDDKGSNAGAAYLFQRTGDTWVQTEKRTAAKESEDNLFGDSVSISGYHAITGAPGDNNSGGSASIGSGDPVPPSLSPTILNPGDQSTPKDTSIEIFFTVYDPDTPAGNIKVFATSENASVISNDAINTEYSAADAGYFLTLAPTGMGTAKIIIEADDHDHPPESVSFMFTVNNPPVINGLDETIVINENILPDPIGFTVSNATRITVSGISSNSDLVPNSNIGFSGTGPTDQTVTITPVSGMSGSADITVTVRDNDDGDIVSKTFTFIVNGAPGISEILPQETQEDMPYFVDFTVDDETAATDFDVFASWGSAEMSEGNLNMTGTGASRRLIITPPANESGTAQIIVAVQNQGGAITTRTFSFEVTPVNDKPDITGPEESALMSQDTTADFTFEIGDVDDAPGRLTVTASSSNTDLVPNANIEVRTSGPDTQRILTITPTGYGTANITVTVSDGELVDNITFELTVNARPLIDWPLGSTVMDEDTPTDFTFEVSDPDDSADSLSTEAVSDNPSLIPSRNIRIGGTGTERRITFTPGPDQFGTTEITLTVTDDKGAQREKRFFLEVSPVNDPPVVSWIGPRQGAEDGWTDSIPFSVTDAEGGNLTVSVTPGNFTLIPNDGNNIRIASIGVTNYSTYGEPGISVPMDLKFLPAQDQFGVSEITVKARDGENAEGSTLFTLTIGAANDPPTLSNIEDQITDEDIRTSEIPFTVGDKDPDMLTISVSSDDTELIPLSGIRVIGVDSANQVAAAATVSLGLTLTPAPDRFGSAVITVNVDDGTDTVSDTFLLTVNSVNDPPEITDIETTLIVTEDTSDSFSFTVSDPDTPLSYVQVSSASSNVALVPEQYAYLHTDGIGSVRTLFVKPAKDADTNTLGTTYITLTADDGEDGTAERRVSLRVTSLNDPPTIGGTPLPVINEEDFYSFAPEASDIDNDISELIFTIEHKPSWAGFDETTGILSGTPGDSDVGKTTGIVITVTDPSGEQASMAPFDIEVLNVNDPPTVSEIGNQVTDEDTPTDSIRFSVTDTEGGRLLISASSSDISLIPNNAINIGGLGPNYVITTLPGETRELSLVLSPAANQNGTATITLTVNDGEDDTQAPFYVMVRPANDTPELSLIPNQDTNECTAEDMASCVVEAAFTVTDPEGGTLTITAVSDKPDLVPDTGFDIIGTDTQGRVNASPDQQVGLTLKITPAMGESGATFVTVTASDESETDTVTFLLTVNYVNKLPEISDIQTMITEEDTPVDVTFTVTDIEGGNFPIVVQSEDTVRVPNDPEHISIILDDQAFGPEYMLSMQPQGGNPATQDVIVRVVPAENQSGSIEFSVTVSDSGGDVEKTFFVSISRVNDPPVIDGLANQDTDEDVPVENIPFSVKDSEGGMFEGGTLRLSVTSSDENVIPADEDHIVINTVPPTGAGFGPNYDMKLSPGAEKNLTLSLTPAQGASGEAEITVHADDGSGTETATSETMFLFNVGYVNKEPVIDGLYDRTTPEDEPIDIIFTVTDIEGGALPISAKSADGNLVPNDPEHISINELGPDQVLMMGPDDVEYPTLTLTPASNKSGTTKITVTVQDGDYMVEKMFYLTITPRNDGPTIDPIPNTSIGECQSDDDDSCVKNVTLTVNDLEGGWITLSAVSSSDTDLVPNDDNHVNMGGFGTSTSEFLSAGGSATVTLTLRPESGVIPAGEAYGDAEITVTAADEDGGWSQQTFTLKVDRTNKPPVITGIWDQNMKEDDPAKDVIFRITDDEGGEFHITVESNNTNLFPEDYGHLNIQGYGPYYVVPMDGGGAYADLTLSLTPASEEFGVAVITVTVTDGPPDDSNHIVEKKMVVNVQPENDGPSVSAIPNQTTSEGQPTGGVSFTVSDPEGGLIDISVTSSDTTLVPEDDIHINIGGFGRNHTVSAAAGTNVGLSLTLTPASDQFGTANITVTVADREGGSDSKTFKLMVGVVNEPPELSEFSSQITNEDTPTGNIPFTVTDAEGGGPFRISGLIRFFTGSQ